MKKYYYVLFTFFLLFSCISENNKQTVAGANNGKQSVANNTKNTDTLQLILNNQKRILGLETRVASFENRINVLEKQLNKNKNKQSSSFTSFLVMAIIFFLFIGFLFLKRKTIFSLLKKKLKKEKTKKRDRKNKQKNQVKIRQRKNAKNKNDEYDNISDDETYGNLVEDESLQDDCIENESFSPNTVIFDESTSNDDNWAVESKKQTENIFYLPTPSAEGDFDSFYASPFIKKGQSVYECRYIDQAKTKAKFELIRSHEVEEKAVSAIEYILYPVCEDYDTYSRGLKLKRIEPGIIKLEGARWRLEKKAIIEFV